MAIDPDQLLKPAKRLRKLLLKIDRDPTPEQVHDLRPNVRRIDAISQALSLDDENIEKSASRDLTRVRRTAGKVRDMDVLMEFASRVRIQDEKECSVRLLEYLGFQRRKRARKLRAAIQRLRPSLRKGLKHDVARLRKISQDKGDPSRLVNAATSAAAIALKLSAQLNVPRRLGRETLHPYRLKVKELRNVLKIAASQSEPRFVEELGSLKDAIGEWHDWEEIVSIAEKRLEHGARCRLTAELKRTAAERYERALAQAERFRRNYLRNPATRRPARSNQFVGERVWEAISTLAA
jgi:CHAD domain-containing protein